MKIIKDLVLAAASHEDIIAAKKTMLTKVVNNTTMDDAFTREERLQMAYAPVIMTETIWQYIDKITAYCATNKISEVKKLSRAIKGVKDRYYDFLRKSIDRAHLDSAAARGKQFMADFGRDMTIMWFTIRAELLKKYPNMAYMDMRTDALCAMLLVKVMKKFCADTDKEIEKRTNIEANTMNPMLKDLDVIMDGYIGDYEIDRTELVRRCEVILCNAMKSIDYNEYGE